MKETKTKHSRRRIRLSAQMTQALRAWRQQTPGRLVFPARGLKGNRYKEHYIDKSSLYRAFERLLKKADLPRIRFHDLRHTNATLALLKTKNIKAVSCRLGHSDIRVTLNTYAHYLPTMEEEIITAMEAIMFTQPPEEKEVASNLDKPQTSPTEQECTKAVQHNINEIKGLDQVA